MLVYMQGDLFRSSAQTLVNTVNTVGVMGKGIAKTFREIYPEMFKTYQKLCESGRFDIGSLFIYRTPNKLILNFPTKKHWRSPSKPEYIESGLAKFVETYNDAGIHSVAFPPLGCGNGELDFGDVVRPLMEEYLRDLPIPVYIYPPQPQPATPEHRHIDQMKAWLRSEPRAMPFSELWDDLREVLRDQDTFRTIAQDTPFLAEITDSEPAGIRIRASRKTLLWRRTEVRDLWQQLREHGLVMSGGMVRRAHDMSYILPVLARLPYISVVRIGESYGALQYSPTFALQLEPSTQSQSRAAGQLELV
jgi:O-acetyl-ADP-ribose deacetylase (regulator of RNase III)